jgi:predicted flap endonuclease-1-like 5' DNA nuclease
VVNKNIEDIEGIGPSYGEKLKTAGITCTDELLEKGCTPTGRAALAEATGIHGKVLLKWVNMADLYRVKGVGSEYADLLECAGVDTVKELRNRNAENLTARMTEVNEEKKLTRRNPNLTEVQGWIAHAAELPPKLEY